MHGVLLDVVVSVLDAVELDDKGVCDAVLETLDTVVRAADRGLDVWLLRGGMDAAGSKAEHLVGELEGSVMGCERVKDTNYLLSLLGRDVGLELEEYDVDEGSNVGHCCDDDE